MEKILLFGAHGQLGWELCRTLASHGTLMPCARANCNLELPEHYVALIRDYQPTIIVNAAAYTAVDRAEQEPVIAWRINGEAPGVIAEEAKKLGAVMIHFSTDYLFDGKRGSPYREEDLPAPLNVYGQSKLCGEQNICAVGGRYLILRTGWLYSLHGHNFLKSMIALAAKGSRLTIVDDQIGAPTWSRLLAEVTSQLVAVIRNRGIEPFPWGIYHAAAQGHTSWYHFAQSIFRLSGLAAELSPITSLEYGARALRPHYSVLSSEKLQRTFGLEIPHWEAGLRLCLES
jgi:dTDP-4-dehydrorhamnose reductase